MADSLVPLRNVFDHVAFIIHTHSDDETGDLTYTSRSTKTKTLLATPINKVSCLQSLVQSNTNTSFQFFDTVVSQEMTSYLESMKFSAFFLLACGAVVQVVEARQAFTQVVSR